MPELPEVQTVVNDLKGKVVGRKIVSVWVGAPKLVKKGTVERLKKELIGREILNVGRRAKNILFRLSGRSALLVHLKMTGHFLLKKAATPGIAGEKDFEDSEYIRFALCLDNGKILALSDLRKFANIIFFKREEEVVDYLRPFGPDALEIGLDDFSRLIRRKKSRIKPLLMDQSAIAGVGNIYSDEILYRAKIHPLERTDKLTDAEIKKIYSAMRTILSEAIKKRGASVSDFRDIAGREGRYEEKLLVYGREGLPCLKKDGRIVRMKIAGRSAYFCPAEQKLKK
jgi:formamidopyrimidine-DNA glycosylase